MVTASLYDAEGRDRDVALDAPVIEALTPSQLLWIDVNRANGDELAPVAALLGIERDAAHELALPERAPALARYGNHFQFGVVIASAAGVAPRVSFAVHPRWLLTVHDGDCEVFAAFRAKDRAETMTGALTPAALAASLLGWCIDSYFAEIGRIEDAVDKLDGAVLGARADRAVLGRLAAMQRRAARLRACLAENRGAVQGLLRPDFDLVADEIEHYRAVASQFERAVDSVERAREAIVASFELFASKAALETNDLVKALTFVTVIIGFSAAIAGLFGMNFKTSFTDSGEWGFHVVLASLAVTVIMATVVARKRGWI